MAVAIKPQCGFLWIFLNEDASSDQPWNRVQFLGIDNLIKLIEVTFFSFNAVFLVVLEVNLILKLQTIVVVLRVLVSLQLLEKLYEIITS